MKFIELTGVRGAGLVAIVDDVDYDRISAFPWRVTAAGYTDRRLRVCEPHGGARISIHRSILGLVPGDGIVVDHINRDPLDNRRENLRRGTHAFNSQNRPSCRGSSSSFRNVTWHRSCRRWQAQVECAGQRYYLGLFDDELEAARVAQQKRIELMPFAVESVLIGADAS